MINPDTVRNLIAIIPAAIIAITFHEAAHGYVAERLGDRTARLDGRLTLNPIAHIDIFGTLLMPVLLAVLTGGRFVFGYAKPVPVNPFNLKNPRRDMALVAAAGPATNLALATASAILLRIFGLFGQPGSQASEWILLPIISLLWFSILINAILCCFNLIPIPPLDGGRVLVGIVPADWAGAIEKVEPFGIAIVLILVILDPLGIATHTIWALNDVLVKFMSVIAGAGGF